MVAWHYDDVIMTMLASQISSLPVVCSIVYSDVNQRKHQSSASLAFVREIHRGPVNFLHKWPVTRKMFPFDDVIMRWTTCYTSCPTKLPKLLLFCRIFSNVISQIKIDALWFEFHWNLSPQVHFTMPQCQLGTKQATSHYMDQYLPNLLMHVFVTQPQCINRCHA